MGTLRRARGSLNDSRFDPACASRPARARVTQTKNEREGNWKAVGPRTGTAPNTDLGRV
jgi:hypothetical protein